MARIGHSQVSEGVLADEFDLIDKDADATCVSCNLTSRTAEPSTMFQALALANIADLRAGSSVHPQMFAVDAIILIFEGDFFGGQRVFSVGPKQDINRYL